MNQKEALVLGALGLGIVALLYVAVQQTDIPVPQTQDEYQTMGIAVPAGLKLGAGTPLDMRHEVHFWNPGDYGEDIGVITTPHRYPSVPGGNVTAIMHQGWACITRNSPVNEWFYNPPEVAVL